MSLAALPNDFWDAVSTYIDTNGFCSLMLTGDAAIRLRLSRGLKKLIGFRLRFDSQHLGHILAFQSLLTLHIWSLASCELPKGWVARLPVTLRDLRLPCQKREPGELEHLPRELTALRLDGNTDLSSIISHLPKNLTIFNAAYATFNPTLTPSLPPLLTSLSTSTRLLNDNIGQLSREILDLELLSGHALEDCAIALLPPAITRFVAHSVVLMTDDCMAAMPTSLQTLVLSSGLRFTPKVFHQLPPKITQLDLGRHALVDMTDKDFLMLPKAINALSLSNNRHLTEAIVESLPLSFLRSPDNLPPKLIPLVVKKYLPNVGSFLRISSWLAPVFNSAENWLLLPSTVTSIDTHALDDTHLDLSGVSFYSILPAGLRTLWLGNITSTLNADIGALPRALTVLRAPHACHITDEAIPLLPPQLQTLELGRSKLTDKCVSLLPRTLEVLLLKASSHITKASFSDLPRRLKALDLSWSKQVDDSSISNLPPLLTDLRLSSAHLLTDACLPHFPSTITNLDLGHSVKLSHAALNAAFPPSKKVLLILPQGRELEGSPW